jgi:hypothetical protein
MKFATASALILTLTSAAHAAGQPSFQWQTIDPAISVGYGLAIADINGDKKPDIWLADAKDIVCYVAPEWKRQVLASRLTLRDNVCLAAADIDGDGLAELAAGANWNPGNTTDPKLSGSTHFLLRGKSEWQNVPLPHEPTAHRMRWVRCSPTQFSLAVLPLHGVANAAVNLSTHLPPALADAGSPAAWKSATHDTAMRVTHNFDQRSLGSVDELLVGGKEGAQTYRPVNGGAGWQKTALEITADTPSPGVGEIRYLNAKTAETFDFATIEPFHGNTLAVYRQAKNGKSWAREVVDDETLNQGHALACGDVLGLGSQQIAVGWREPNSEKKVGVRLYWQDEPNLWKSAWLADNTVACEDLKLADLDADGDLDIIVAGRATKNVMIGWNKRL